MNVQINEGESKNLSQRETKRRRSLVPAVIIFFCALAVILAAFYVFLRIYNCYSFVYILNEDGDTCTISEIKQRGIAPFIYFPEELAVPETMGGKYKVTAIGDGAVKCSAKPAKVTLPEGITSIGEGAFEGCFNLESVTAPGLTSLGEGAFRGCISLTSAELGERLWAIGDFAFEGCASLASFNVPASVESVGEGAFRGCTSLEGISFKNELSLIGAYAFWGCTSLEKIEAKGVFALGEYAFWGCTSLSEANLGAVKSVGEGAFARCTAFELLALADGTEIIGDKAFSGCTSLSRLSLPAGLRGIGDCAFEKCTSLKTVNYAGTPKDWEDITLGELWAEGSVLSSVKADGGEISLNSK